MHIKAKIYFFTQKQINSWYICIRMSQLINDIFSFLSAEGFSCSHELLYGIEGFCVQMSNGSNKTILPLEISATSLEEAYVEAQLATDCIQDLYLEDHEYPLVISEDRWYTKNQMMKSRILAHLEVFSPIYARNCEIRRIDKTAAKEFLEANHSYGYAACRYCYGMFLKRHTGHSADKATITPGTLVAVATFSNARKWIKDDKTIRSYEWTRYASLPEVRLCGGMGKMLKTFIKDIQPDDIMSYADLEWSQGDVYRQLGFELEGQKDPVLFAVDTATWQRQPIKSGMTAETYFQNLGSNKYRLKLTEY